jgi:hypothetical protein
VSALAFERIDPGLLGRCSWETEQAQRDAEVLAWVGRFRFVTAQAIAARFDVSWQQANGRVRRLERVRLLGTERQHLSQARAVFLTGRGHEMLGWRRRRAPRAQIHREHEEAIVRLVTELEREHPDAVVLTERECRQLDDPADGRRYGVEVFGSGRDNKRWPDAVLETAEGRRAFELEFTPKGTSRLKRIVDAYERSGYEDVTFLVKSAALGRRIQGLRRPTDELHQRLGLRRRPVRVVPWNGLPEGEQSALVAGLAG